MGFLFIINNNITSSPQSYSATGSPSNPNNHTGKYRLRQSSSIHLVDKYLIVLSIKNQNEYLHQVR